MIFREAQTADIRQMREVRISVQENVFCLIKPIAFVSYPPTQKQNRDGADDSPHERQNQIRHKSE
jgi:hypothetical protein